MTNIDVDKLTNLIMAFYDLTGIKVAVYNNRFCEILSCPEENSPFCTMIQNNSVSRHKCEQCMQVLCRQCADSQKLITVKCHAGLTEVIAPLSDGTSTIGYIMFGQFTNVQDRGQFMTAADEQCQDYQIDRDLFAKKLETVKYVSDARVENISAILNALAGYIVYDKLVYSRDLSGGQKIMEYIKANLDRDLSVEALCQQFYLSKSEIYRLTKPYAREGIASCIKKMRMESACQALRYTDKPIWRIARETGFSDVNYFMRTFKKTTGLSAAKYREQAAK